MKLRFKSGVEVCRGLCYGAFVGKLLLLLSFCTSILAFSAADAQGLPVRALPANGKLGRVGEPQALPLVQIGGRVMRLAPGGVIYDQHNRSIVHASLPPHSTVLYTADANGDVQRIYVLTDEERVRVEQAQRK